MIDYVYANTHDFESTMKVFCPYFPISDDFVENQVFFAVYHKDPIKQLDMIHYRFESVCHKQSLISEYSMTFSAGNMTFHKELCIEKDGKWADYQFDSKCYFETDVKYKLAEEAFVQAGRTNITGEVAKNICAILDIPCPEEPKFEAFFNRDEGIATFIYFKNQERFNFIIEDAKILYRTDASGNEWIIFDKDN